MIDLFSTIGKVNRAEIQYEPNGRSRGTGVVEFDSPDTAETAIGEFVTLLGGVCLLSHDHLVLTISSLLAKFTGYQYGGRPLGITFVKYLSAGGAPADMMEGAEPTDHITQDQIM